MDLVWAAAVLGTEFTCGNIWQDQAPAAHIPCPSRRAQRCSARGSAFTAPLPLPAADPFPGTAHDEGGLMNGISEAALPAAADAHATRHALPRDPSLFQVTKIHQSPMVATLGVDSSARDTGEETSPQQPAATEESKAHAGKEEL